MALLPPSVLLLLLLFLHPKNKKKTIAKIPRIDKDVESQKGVDENTETSNFYEQDNEGKFLKI